MKRYSLLQLDPGNSTTILAALLHGRSKPLIVKIPSGYSKRMPTNDFREAGDQLYTGYGILEYKEGIINGRNTAKWNDKYLFTLMTGAFIEIYGTNTAVFEKLFADPDHVFLLSVNIPSAFINDPDATEVYNGAFKLSTKVNRKRLLNKVLPRCVGNDEQTDKCPGFNFEYIGLVPETSLIHKVYDTPAPFTFVFDLGGGTCGVAITNSQGSIDHEDTIKTDGSTKLHKRLGSIGNVEAGLVREDLSVIDRDIYANHYIALMTAYAEWVQEATNSTAQFAVIVSGGMANLFKGQDDLIKMLGFEFKGGVTIGSEYDNVNAGIENLKGICESKMQTEKDRIDAQRLKDVKSAEAALKQAKENFNGQYNPAMSDDPVDVEQLKAELDGTQGVT